MRIERYTLLAACISTTLLVGCREQAHTELAASESSVRAGAIRKLVPPASHVFDASKLIDEPQFYAFFGSERGANLTIQGTRVVHHDEAPFVPNKTHVVRGVRALLFEVDDIRTVTWVEDSVAYAADLECAVAGDARCADANYLLGIVDSLVVAGGSQ